MSEQMIDVADVAKEFVLHAQGAARLPVFGGVSFALDGGACMALAGPSGVGKSTLMRMIYANFRCATGHIRIRHRDGWIDMARAHPHDVLNVRRETLGYVSQFLRVLPRVPTLEIVMEPARARGIGENEALSRAGDLLTRLRVPEKLWSLSPVTFSGGEQQRVNLARGFIARHPVMLLDEPTASLDVANRATVIDMINEARTAGTAMIGIFHDQDARDAVCDRELDMTAFASRAA